jgi:hypothetical protein
MGTCALTASGCWRVFLLLVVEFDVVDLEFLLLRTAAKTVSKMAGSICAS